MIDNHDHVRRIDHCYSTWRGEITNITERGVVVPIGGLRRRSWGNWRPHLHSIIVRVGNDDLVVSVDRHTARTLEVTLS